MAGRAGRRGFDLEGRVILAGLPSSKIKRLLANRLPDIISSSPVTPTSAMRLLVNYAVNRDEQILNIARTFVSHPLFFNRSNQLSNIKKEIVTGSHMLLSCEYLLREGVVDKNGMPVESGTLAYHLYWLEPNNFWLVALLRSSLFDDLTSRTQGDPDQAIRLAEVLSNIFCKVALHDSYTKESGISIVSLPPLPEDFQKCLLDHEERLTNYSRDFSAWFVREYRDQLGDDNVMPLSNVTFQGQHKPSHLSQKMISMGGGVGCVSNFAGISGVESDNVGLSTLCSIVRSGVALEKSILPSVDVANGIKYNAYIVDFLRHGNRKALILDNRIRPEILWESLREFGLILQILTSEMRRRAETIGKNVASAEATANLFLNLNNKFKQTFDASFELSVK